MCFVGKDVICIGSGYHLVFINLVTEREVIYTANNSNSQKTGDGIKYFAGHRSLSIFAFAENCYNPNVYVHSYPEFGQIAVLESNNFY